MLNYDELMGSALIFVDNLRIGGFQRLALDEAYELSDQGFDCTIITLEDPCAQPNKMRYLSKIESGMLESKKIQVNILPGERPKLYKQVRRLLKTTNEPLLIISHSLRSTLILRLVKITAPLLQIQINTKIHQIPSLIDRKQRLKRFIYAQFSDELFCFSEAVKISWYEQFGKGFTRFMRISKRIILLRNGIYVPRLPKVFIRPEGDTSKPRLIFLGRLTFWKGLEVFERLAREPQLTNFDFLFVVPSDDDISLKAISEVLGDRMEIITGKSVGDLEFYPGDVHLYPTQYGNTSIVTESISLNCLEMAGIGIPSIVTSGGQLTWNEIEFSEIFFEVDWGNLEDVVSQINRASRLRLSKQLQSRLVQLISISNEITVLRK